LSTSLPVKNVETKSYTTQLILVALSWREIWFLAIMGEHRLNAFENRIPRVIFGDEN
jgi:hypothetical protein